MAMGEMIGTIQFCTKCHDTIQYYTILSQNTLLYLTTVWCYLHCKSTAIDRSWRHSIVVNCSRLLLIASARML